jgi:hypothetical protein
MTIRFVCKITAHEGNTYTVELNSSNLLALPEDSITIRKFTSNLDLPIGSMVYVTKSILNDTGTTKKLTVEDAFILTPALPKISTIDTNSFVMSEEIRKMILDSSYCPVHLLK